MSAPVPDTEEISSLKAEIEDYKRKFNDPNYKEVSKEKLAELITESRKTLNTLLAQQSGLTLDSFIGCFRGEQIQGRINVGVRWLLVVFAVAFVILMSLAFHDKSRHSDECSLWKSLELSNTVAFIMLSIVIIPVACHDYARIIVRCICIFLVMMIGWWYSYSNVEYAYTVFLAAVYGALQWILEMVVCTEQYRNDCRHGLTTLGERFPTLSRCLNWLFCCLWSQPGQRVEPSSGDEESGLVMNEGRND